MEEREYPAGPHSASASPAPSDEPREPPESAPPNNPEGSPEVRTDSEETAGGSENSVPSQTPAGNVWLRELREWVRVLVYVVAFYFALTSLVVEGYYIPSCSMEPTLRGIHTEIDEDGREVRQPGDRIIALKGLYTLTTPARGDIVIFEKVEEDRRHAGEDDTLLVKRVVGLAGEEIEIRDGWLYVKKPGADDFEPLPRELFPDDQEYDNRGPHGAPGRPERIPEGHCYVLGDNTWNSNDSRVWGCVPHANIRGKALVRFWPLARIGVVE